MSTSAEAHTTRRPGRPADNPWHLWTDGAEHSKPASQLTVSVKDMQRQLAKYAKRHDLVVRTWTTTDAEGEQHLHWRFSETAVSPTATAPLVLSPSALLAAARAITPYRHDFWQTTPSPDLDPEALSYAAAAIEAVGDELAQPSYAALRAAAAAIYPYRHNGDGHGTRVLTPAFDCWRYAEAALAAAGGGS